ncbi:hypothetical protein L1080_027715 [Rhodococcus sp. MSC1_016]|jgi:hypothetical protein|uniref:hypothetical protein n=1 Tax=Rhodococcus sp. MSC1_016 TaxID=2909266 RepID=UPI00202EF0AE|nr:hypothetical protein [Rhodococcus sp. MSC1_016]
MNFRRSGLSRRAAWVWGRAGSRFHEWLEVRPFQALLPTATEYSVNEIPLRSLIPSMFADAVQDALIEADRMWPTVADAKGGLVAWPGAGS